MRSVVANPFGASSSAKGHSHQRTVWRWRGDWTTPQQRARVRRRSKLRNEPMAENSKIEWCDHTFNPWIGCQKVSPGCDHCYAETMMDHRYHRVEWGPHGERMRTSPARWRKPLQWARAVNGNRQK